MYEALFERLKSTDLPIGKCRLAYYFAKGRHAHQKRKGSGLPYFVHPRGVAYIVMENGGNENQICAALLHDLLEDTETSYLEIQAGFGTEVADLCSELRNNRYKIEEMGKEGYMTEKLKNLSDDALFVKLADMLYNLNDQPEVAAQVRMLKNVQDLIIARGEDMPQAIYKLAMEVYGG